jgi:tRNA threonylcarbamoyladenosine biosynthesis protein TsaE
MKIHLPDAAAQEAFGGRLARAFGVEGLVVFLEGDLGAGKTTLVRGVLRGLGHEGTVRSPTYTLIEPYEVGGRRCAHLDLYRLADPGELEYLGLRDLLAGDQLLFIEWPAKGAGVLPAPDLRVMIEIVAEGRDLALEPVSARGRRLVSRLRILS